MPSIMDLANCVYVPTEWFNGQAPAINASNLNKIEQGIVQSTECINELNTKVDQLDDVFYHLDGSRALTNNLNAGNHQLKYVAEGVDDDDGATVGQLGQQMQDHLDEDNPHPQYVLKAGDTMTGDLYAPKLFDNNQRVHTPSTFGTWSFDGSNLNITIS